MALYKAIRYGKERREEYRIGTAKCHDISCRNHGSCPYCREGRLIKTKLVELVAEEAIRDWKEGKEYADDW